MRDLVEYAWNLYTAYQLPILQGNAVGAASLLSFKVSDRCSLVELGSMTVLGTQGVAARVERRDTRRMESLKRRPSVAITPNRFPLQKSLACVRLVAVLCVLAWTPRLAAQAPNSVLLERLTWTEIGDAVHAGKTTIIIPVGGTEQSGPYMAVGKHNVRVAALSDRIARQLGNALVAPVIAYVPEGNTSPPTSHMRFPGTITVPTDVFERTVESAAESFRVQGFTDIVLLGDHGGYQDSLKVDGRAAEP